MPTHLEVDRRDHSVTRIVATDDAELAEGQVRVAVDVVALTANNITYAVMGDLLDYWAFFPTGDPGWGRIPAMGFGDVVDSRHDDVAVGTRLYGWFPMSTSVVVEPRVRGGSLVDTVAHRAAHAPIYRTYRRTDADPMYADGHEPLDALLRGLYSTSWLVDAKLSSEHEDAATVVVTSASSKTSLALAHRRVSRERAGRTIGLTSPRNLATVRAREIYDQVLTYDEASEVGSDGSAVIVDMAGDASTLAALHGALAGDLQLSLTVGISHGEPPTLPEGTPGPQPELFFAPAEVERLTGQLGADGYERELAEAYHGFVAWAGRWLTPAEHASPQSCRDAYDRVRTGQVPADVGTVLRLSGW